MNFLAGDVLTTAIILVPASVSNSSSFCLSMKIGGTMNALLVLAAIEDDRSGIEREEEYAWLAEIDTPDDLHMRPGTYTGPPLEK